MAYDLGGLFGGLIICFLVSRGVIRLLRSWNSPIQRALLAGLITLGIATLLGGFGFADGGAPRFGHAFQRYLVPVLLIAVIDVIRLRRNRARHLRGWRGGKPWHQ